MLYLNFGAQGRGSTFTFCHAHLKKAILLHKMARVPFDLLIAVYGPFGSDRQHPSDLCKKEESRAPVGAQWLIFHHFKTSIKKINGIEVSNLICFLKQIMIILIYGLY